MAGKSNYTCAKCGIKSQDDTSVTFHRFPVPSVHGPLKAKVWAKFCFPNEDWTEDQSLYKLFKSHKMICGKHFDESAYTCSERKRLNKFAIPTEARGILAQLKDQQNYSNVVTPEPLASTSSCPLTCDFVALTQQHQQLNGKQKMKVRLAAQVLSHSVAAGLFAKIGQG